ncbi:UNVERIFIED_CONTAM: hypothetical protein H355_005660 [Colinus virginianus]|nr:hypothetical protein H355_005660 [Colinus virginianus]
MLRGAHEGQLTAVTGALTAASVLCQVEPVGRWFEAFIKRRNINVSASFQELEDEKELSEESGDEELQLEEFPMLKTLDPKDWKNQDHYAVLGLGNIRYRATQKQIKAAHKSMVLKHHPDKRKAAGEQIGEGDNDYFTCITKDVFLLLKQELPAIPVVTKIMEFQAVQNDNSNTNLGAPFQTSYEILSDPVKRRAFNSIDPTFDNSVPSKSEAKENFFEVFSPVFERNASLQCLNEALTSTTREGGKAAVVKQIEEINEQIRREKEEAEARMRQATKSSEKSTTGGGGGSKNWPEDDLQLLIKAVNLFPAGTNSRTEIPSFTEDSQI